MAKKKQKSKANSSFATYFKIFFIFLFLLCIGFLIYLNINESKVEESKTNTIKQSEITSHKKSEKTVVNAINNYENKRNLKQEIQNTENKHKTQNNNNIKDDKTPCVGANCFEIKEHSAFGKDTKATNIKAKLAIIIDDVATRQESDEIKAIIKSGKKITPSFFPNTNNHPNTNDFAKEFSHYMIHLPLRAVSFSKEEPLTLTPQDDYKNIENRIKNIKIAFPNLKFLNNHTGSAFTSDEDAMRRLFKALKKYDLIFVDSRTIASTKAPVLAKEFKQNYIHRNIFLDNSQNLSDINKKLDEAVQFALKNKRAIAIAHPHKNSLKAISEYDFSKVELVYIDDIYNDYK